MFEWLEGMFKMGPTWQAMRERSTSRRLISVFKKEPGVNKKLKKMIGSGNINKVVKAFRAEEKLDGRESKLVFLVLKKMRVVIYKQLDALKQINMEINADKNLLNEEKAALVRKINDDVELIKKVDTALLQGEDNFSHGDRTLTIREALDEASMLNDFYFATRMERRYVRRTRVAERKLDGLLKKAAKNDKVKKIIDKLDASMQVEEKNELKEATDAMVLLYDIEKKLLKDKGTIEELITREGFPPESGKKIVEEFDQAGEWMKKQAAEDVQQERFGLSKVARSKLKPAFGRA